MRRRLPGLIYLCLSLLFLLLPPFRWILEISFRDRAPGDIMTIETTVDDMREKVLPATEITALAQRAASSGDGRGLAFVALTSHSPDEALRTADQAYALDPKLGWIGYYLLPIKQDPDANARWLAHLQAYEPDNGAVYFAEARCLEATHSDFPKTLHAPKGWTHPDPSPLVPQTEWLAAMEKGFAAPHYHGYEQERFLLDRDVMQQLGRDTPWKLAVVSGDQPMSYLLGVRNYANYKIYYLAENAARAHRYDQAIEQVRQTSAFGQRMANNGRGVIEQLIGQAIDDIAADGEADLLRAQGRTAEAEIAANRKVGYRGASTLYRHEHQVLNDQREFDMVYTHLLSYLYVAVAILAVLLTLWAFLRRDSDTRLDRFVGGTATWLSRLLLVIAIALLAIYLPYAQRFHGYMQWQSPDTDYFFQDVAPSWINGSWSSKLIG